MKGIFLQRPLEFAIEIQGESWQQGDNINGSLAIISHSSESDLNIENIGVHLCQINTKKFKAKDPGSVTLISSQMATNSTTEFNFKLKENCHISEKSTSLFILCGDINSPFESGILELNVLPAKTIQLFQEIFENFFKFSFKTFKNKKDKKFGDFIDCKITPPKSPEWTPILGMNLKTRILDESFELIFSFKLKTMSYELDSIGTKDSKKEITKTLSKKQYLSFGDNLNQDFCRKLITEVLNEVKLKKLV